MLEVIECTREYKSYALNTNNDNVFMLLVIRLSSQRVLKSLGNSSTRKCTGSRLRTFAHP